MYRVCTVHTSRPIGTFRPYCTARFDIRYVEHPLFFMSNPQYDISYVVLITKYDLKLCLTYFRPYFTAWLDIRYVEHPHIRY